jgi:hypothetical protein
VDFLRAQQLQRVAVDAAASRHTRFDVGLQLHVFEVDRHDLGRRAGSLFEGSFFGTGEIYNPFDPGLFRAVSELRHNTPDQHQLGVRASIRPTEAVGKQLEPRSRCDCWWGAGLAKWTSGLPFGVQNGLVFPTNWELNGFANLVGRKAQNGYFRRRGRRGEYVSESWRGDFRV